MILPVKTPIIPPLKKPATVVMQPTPKLRAL
jgi:hypothetical protein